MNVNSLSMLWTRPNKRYCSFWVGKKLLETPEILRQGVIAIIFILLMSEQKFDLEIKQENELPKNQASEHFRESERMQQTVIKAEPRNEADINHKKMYDDSLKEEAQEGTESAVRASYKWSSSPPPIFLECRVLQSFSEQKSLMLSTKKDSTKGRPCNQTKNIAKNYGKAIIAFIHNNRKVFRKICKECSTPYQRVTQDLAQLKNTLSTVTGFRKVWTEYRYAECIRRVSNLFLRRVALSYIFNSKIDNYKSHIKYRTKFLESLRDPHNFDHLKDY